VLSLTPICARQELPKSSATRELFSLGKKKVPFGTFYFPQRLQPVQMVPQPTSANVASTKAFSNFFQALLMYFMSFPSVEKVIMPDRLRSKIQTF